MKRCLALGILVVIVVGWIIGNVTTNKVAELVPIEPRAIVFNK